jgi:hypothetical protein
MQAPLPSGRSWDSAERRTGTDRRIGDRRARHVEVPVDRRRPTDRRARLGRRETAEGHLRNAIQLLTGLANQEPALGQSAQQLVDDLLRRLHLALAETRFLEKTRLDLTNRVRQANRPATG